MRPTIKLSRQSGLYGPPLSDHRGIQRRPLSVLNTQPAGITTHQSPNFANQWFVEGNLLIDGIGREDRSDSNTVLVAAGIEEASSH
jgi:hypothetical protein